LRGHDGKLAINLARVCILAYAGITRAGMTIELNGDLVKIARIWIPVLDYEARPRLLRASMTGERAG
jgi:hypothetical protein